MVALEMGGQSGESRGQRQNRVVLENISYGQLQAISAVPADSPALGVDERGEGSGSGSYVITPPQILPGRGVIKRFGSAGRVHVLPMHADWFSPNTVHRLERQVVPHFFSGKSTEHTPEKYMECRNQIVANYMENPEKYLSVADCQGLVDGVSIDDLTRIVRFLDHWGIINYCANPPKLELRKDGTYLYEEANGELCVPSEALKSIDSLIHFDKPKCRLRARDVYPELACNSDNESDFDSTIREQLSENRCNYCSRPVSVVYYQSQKEAEVVLCLDCFHEGKFVIGHSSLDFVKVSSMKDYGDLDGETWTDQETLLLLEGMQLYKENWIQVAEHVGSKSKAQCILHFVRLPLDGAQLENIDVPSTSSSLNFCTREEYERPHSYLNGNNAGSSFQDFDSDDKFPFAHCGNPVMALVAFLASAVGPRVAAACAHASLAALSSDDNVTVSGNTGQIDGSRPNNGVTVGTTYGKDGNSSGDLANSSQCKGTAPLPVEKVKVAAKIGLSAAAMKAKLFADHEEREIQRLSANIINHQLKRLELKLKQFAEVETLLMRECEQMERRRQRMAGERNMMTSQFGSTAVPRSIGLSGVGTSMINNTSVNSRPPVVSGSQQPFISGYGNNQPLHPHMQFMPQQGMYGLGPRLPLSAIHPSSASANAMFNAAANSQPALGHPMLRPASGTKPGLG
nr:SWI/SNF complex subunit SWI3C [Ipomoea batatas]GME11883.1 SWI/SNF complex subunit SWI3C [Ipomoea batatas]GME17984.1 SWI/SNF complex subunit SWI3C [Ipomoea batatas]